MVNGEAEAEGGKMALYTLLPSISVTTTESIPNSNYTVRPPLRPHIYAGTHLSLSLSLSYVRLAGRSPRPISGVQTVVGRLVGWLERCALFLFLFLADVDADADADADAGLKRVCACMYAPLACCVEDGTGRIDCWVGVCAVLFCAVVGGEGRGLLCFFVVMVVVEVVVVVVVVMFLGWWFILHTSRYKCSDYTCNHTDYVCFIRT